ncbi:MAG: ABC transporter permease [Pseudomonadota bacterium]
MASLWESSSAAFWLLLSFDPTLWEIVGISFRVSLQAILYTSPVGIACGFALAYFRFPGRQVLITLANTLWAVPAVVVGLTLYLLLSRSGPLGDWQWLFTQKAMILGQMLLAFPIIVVMAHSAFQASDRRAMETALTLGASPVRAFVTVMHEVRFGLCAAIIAAFGRVIAEVGCSMMVGGNILHATRNIPTAIALETSKGAFTQGIALGIVLVILALGLNFGVVFFRGRGAIR